VREEETSIAELAVPENSLGFLLWQVSQSWRRYFVAGLKPLDLTDLEFCILSGVNHLTRRNGEPPTQVVIANYFSVNVMTASQLVRRLEKRGLVRRRRHATDTRARVLSLTDAGNRTLTEALRAADKLHRSFFRRCDHEKLRVALDELYAADHSDVADGAPPAVAAQ
jgi:DNA-binding MarR family transcriptional regulator